MQNHIRTCHSCVFDQARKMQCLCPAWLIIIASLSHCMVGRMHLLQTCSCSVALRMSALLLVSSSLLPWAVTAVGILVAGSFWRALSFWALLQSIWINSMHLPHQSSTFAGTGPYWRQADAQVTCECTQGAIAESRLADMQALEAEEDRLWDEQMQVAFSNADKARVHYKELQEVCALCACCKSMVSLLPEVASGRAVLACCCLLVSASFLWPPEVQA